MYYGIQLILAHRYARAFLNIFIQQVTTASAHEMKNFSKYLKEHKLVLVYLKLTSISSDYKVELLDKKAKEFRLHSLLSPLLLLLSYHKRLELLPVVLDEIIKLYKIHNNIADFTISSAVPLLPHEAQEIQSFLERSTGKTINSSYAIDKNLIAGIRALSDTFLWEHSVAKQLRKVAAVRL